MSKVLKEHKFHSRSLIPYTIALEGSDAITVFEEEERHRYRFSNGEKVAHVDNPEQLMIVQDIIRKKEMVRGQEKNRLNGIMCHWWEDNS